MSGLFLPPAALSLSPADNSCVALGDSITQIGVAYGLNGAGSPDSYATRGFYPMLIARSGGRLRNIKIDGWPYTGGDYGQVVAVLVARGGTGYSPGTTITCSGFGPSTQPTLTPVIVNGVITGVTITAPGRYNTTIGSIVINDPAGTGSGAVITPILSGTGFYAVGGLSSQQMEAFVPLILANTKARNVFFAGGTNDQSKGMTLADSQASILSTCQRLVAGGKRVFVIAPFDRADKAGSTSRVAATALARWEVEYLQTLCPGVIVVNPTIFLADPNLDSASDGSTGMPVTYTSDGLHFTALGADKAAQAIWQQIAPLFAGPVSFTRGARQCDSYNATTNPEGNLLGPGQALMRSGSSAAGDAPVSVTSGEGPWTGTRPPGVFLSRLAGGTGTGTIAASQQVRNDGRNGTWLVLNVNVTGAAAGETYRLTWSTDGANGFGVQGGNTLQLGWTIRAAIDECVMTCSNLRGLKLRLAQANSQTLTPTSQYGMSGTILSMAGWGDYEDANFPAWNGDKLFLETRPLLLSNSQCYGVGMYLDFVVNTAGAASFTANLFGASLRRLS